MNDIISLVCPSCGGKLEVAKQTDRLICQHCGNEHMVRRENNGVFLEAYARCPNCGRNDKSKKVSAIIRKESFAGMHSSLLSQHLAPPTEPAIKLTPPEKRPNPTSLTAFFAIVAFIVFQCGSYMSIAPRGSNGYYISIISFGLFGIFVIMSIYFGVNEYNAHKKKDTEYKRQLADYEKVFEKKKNEATKVWEQAMKKWELLYYCERDDCLFIPGENISAPASQINDLLYK